MFSGLAKRRKTSPASPVLTVASTKEDDAPERQSRQSAPRRYSFQSPTRASIARFNPELLPRSRPQFLDKEKQGQTESQPRGRSLLSPDEPSRRPADDIIEADFPPLIVLTTNAPQQSPDFEMEVTGERDTPPKEKAMELAREGYDSDGEPKLPPTPVELGLEERAPPPSGILSSSSPSSRSARRKRRRLGDELKSSPLKPRGPQPEGQQPETGEVSLPELRPNAPELSEEVLGKQKLRDRLSAQLDELKGEVRKLENAAQYSERAKHEHEVQVQADAELITLLTASNLTCTPEVPSSPPPPPLSTLLASFLPFAPSRHSHSAFTEMALSFSRPSPYLSLETSEKLPCLTLFTPLVLSSTTKATSSAFERILQSHAITLSAPPPFPARTFYATFILTADPETQTVVSLLLDELCPLREHDGLRHWIRKRLVSPLFDKDMGGLGWGCGRYWEAVVERARVFRQIADALPDFVEVIASSTRREDAELFILETDRNGKNGWVRNLAPLLSRSSLALTRPVEIGSLKKSLLLSYEISLSEWTAEVRREVSICSHGFGLKVQEQINIVFSGLVAKMGVVSAVEGVAGMVLADGL